MMERTGDLSWAVAGGQSSLRPFRGARAAAKRRRRVRGQVLCSGRWFGIPSGAGAQGPLRLVAMRGKGRGRRRRFRGPGCCRQRSPKAATALATTAGPRSRQPRDQRRARRRREELDLRLSPGGARETPRGGRAAPDGPLLRQPARERCDAGAQPRALPGRGRRSRRWPRGFPTTCRSPARMVDRITPRPEPRHALEVAERFGIADDFTIHCEHFIQWVIGDRFIGVRPDLEAAGAELVEDVHPYEEAKIRILNGGHLALPISRRCEASRPMTRRSGTRRSTPSSTR